MNLLEQEIINKLMKFNGLSAEQITHGIKFYDSVEHESMVAAIIQIVQDMQEDKMKTIKKFAISGGLTITAVFAVIMVIFVALFRKEHKKAQAKIDDLSEKLKSIEITDNGCGEKTGNDEINIKCSKCGKQAKGVDEVTVLFGYKIAGDKELIPETICKECREKYYIKKETI